MEKSFDKKLKVKINKEKQSVSLSMKVSDEMVNVFKTSLNEFNIMVAEYQAQLFTLEIDENTIVPSNEIDETPEII
jgi:hypothetical protein|tara:strand:+ start:1255 stop:1482 length:228 start_codon:yes stop_codon:yes gene_type:complete